jgi:hypothetical protein
MPQTWEMKRRARQRVGRLQLQVMRCFWAADGGPVLTRDLASWVWPEVIDLERRPLRKAERNAMTRAATTIGARKVRREGWQWVWILPDDPDDPWD